MTDVCKDCRSVSDIFSRGSIVIVNAIDLLPSGKSNASKTTMFVIRLSVLRAADVNLSAGVSESTMNAKSRVIGWNSDNTHYFPLRFNGKSFISSTIAITTFVLIRNFFAIDGCNSPNSAIVFLPCLMQP